MSKGRPLKPLEVSRETREELRSLARSRSLPASSSGGSSISPKTKSSLDSMLRSPTTLEVDPGGPTRSCVNDS